MVHIAFGRRELKGNKYIYYFLLLDELSVPQSLEEIKEFLTAIDLPHNGKTIFRSDHASNYLVLKGRLGRDKDKLIEELQSVLDGDGSKIRPEWLRGL